MTRRYSLSIDLDSVLNQLCEEWIINRYNKYYNDNLTMQDIKEWDTSKIVKPECGKRVYDILLEPHLFRDLNVQPNSQEVTEWLSHYFDIYAVTAYTYTTCADKAEFLIKNFPHINIDNLVFCNDKSIIKTDFLLDDGSHNAKGFNGRFLLFGQPWNEHIQGHIRLNDWLEVKKYFERILNVQ